MLLTDAQVIAAFGDPTPYLRPDGSIDDAWRTVQLAYYTLPAPLPLSGMPSARVTRVQVHRKLVGAFASAFEAVHADAASWASLGDTGGAFAWRLQRLAKKLSRHCWGIAIDLDVADNPQFSAGKMDPRVIAAFAAAGFEWGGAWKTRKDPMHFEFSDLARLDHAA